VQTTQTYDINSKDRPVDATDHRRNCLITANATAVHRLDDDNRTRAAKLHWWSDVCLNLYSLLVATHSTVCTQVMGKS